MIRKGKRVNQYFCGYCDAFIYSSETVQGRRCETCGRPTALSPTIKQIEDIKTIYKIINKQKEEQKWLRK